MGQMMNLTDQVLITGGRGMLGSALIEELRRIGFQNILAPTRSEMDCTKSEEVALFFDKHRPKYVFHLASLVFGIKGNLDNQLRSFNENTLISINVLNSSGRYGVEKIFYAGTVASYGYPYKSIPLKESDFWDGLPHYGEYGYASAKRHGLIHLDILKNSGGPDFVYGILTNLYGPNDSFDSEAGHVVPSLVSKAVRSINGSRIFDVWGNPAVTRDFLYSKDAARAIILAMEKASGAINIASGRETSMGDVVTSIIDALGGEVESRWLSDKPVGIGARYSDVKVLSDYGFLPLYNIGDGVRETIKWYRNSVSI